MRSATVESRSGMLAVGVFAALVALPGRVEATEFHWDAPNSCPAQDAVVLEIERALGAPLEQFASEALEARVTRLQMGFGARLVAGRDEQQASRELQAPTCEALVEVVALAAALALGASAQSRGSAPAAGAHTAIGTPRAEDPTASAPDTPAVADEGERPAPIRHGGPTTSLLAALSGDSGSLPSPTVGVELGVDVRWASFRLRGVGSWLFERNGQVGGPATAAGARLGLVTGGLLGCTRVSALDAVLPLALCTGVEAGRLSGQGTRVAAPRSRKSSTWGVAG